MVLEERDDVDILDGKTGRNDVLRRVNEKSGFWKDIDTTRKRWMRYNNLSYVSIKGKLL